MEKQEFRATVKCEGCVLHEKPWSQWQYSFQLMEKSFQSVVYSFTAIKYSEQNRDGPFNRECVYPGKHMMHCYIYMASHLGSAQGKHCSTFCLLVVVEGGMRVSEKPLPITDPQTDWISNLPLTDNYPLHYNCFTLTHSVGAAVAGLWTALRTSVSEWKLFPFFSELCKSANKYCFIPKIFNYCGAEVP